MNHKKKVYILGFGCRRDISCEDVNSALVPFMKRFPITAIATCSIKSDEYALLSFAENNNLKIFFFTPEELARVNPPSRSQKVKKYLNIENVCESAILCLGAEIIQTKTILNKKITCAVGIKTIPENTLSIVGIGSGSIEQITPQAKKRILSSDFIIGYKNYISLLPKKWLKGKHIIATGMGAEIQRCKEAIHLASNHKDVCLISSGDPGIYGMSGLIFELLKDTDKDFRIQLVPGITAASTSANILGAPLMNDFAVISLSDLLTPRSEIIKRVNSLAVSDLVCVIYNPKSSKRTTLLPFCIKKFLDARGERTVFGIVKNAGKENQFSVCGHLCHFPENIIDMHSVVIIGNSNTVLKKGRIYTKRGYNLKYML